MKKKLISVAALILAALCLISVFSVSAEETAQKEPFLYENESGLLEALGVLENGEENYSGDINRGDFIQAVMRLCGYEYAGVGIIPPFSDITENDRFYSAVSSAYALGYINESGEFNAKGKVTLSDAAEILTSVLGYSYLSESYNASNALIAAQKIGLIKGVRVISTAITKSDMIKLLYNALFINVMEPATYYASGEYKLGTGETLLSEVFEIYEESGLVEATPLTSLYTEKGCDLGWIEINGAEYKTDEAYYDYIGHTVKYYYTTKNGLTELVYMCDKFDNTVFTVDFDDVEKLTETKLEYTKGKGSHEKKITKFSSFLYNGKLKDFSSIDTNIESGSITLVDSNDDGSYDVVSITEYIHGRVAGIDAGNLKVHTVDGSTYNLKAENEERMVEIILDENLVEFKEIKTDDLLSVVESDGDGLNIIRVYISRNTVEGSITRIKENSIMIDDTEYFFDSKSFTPRMRDYGKFYISVNGKVVHGKLENYVVYGFLYRIANGSGLGPVMAKIYSDKGRWVELELTENVTYNGSRKPSESLETALEFLDDEGNFKPQIVTYRVNSNNKLTVLNTPKVVQRWSAEEKEAMENAEFRQNKMSSETMYFRSTVNSFNMVAFIDTDTYIFVISGSEVDGKFIVDPDKVHLESLNNFVGDSQYGPLEFYDMDEWGTARVVAVYGGTYQLDINIYPVTDVGTSIDSEGNVNSSISIMYNGYELSFDVSDDVSFNRYADMKVSDLKKGDVIRYAADKDGKIGKIEPYIYGEADKNAMTNGIYTTKTIIAGEIERIDLGINKLQIKNNNDRYILDTSAVTNIYRYNTKREAVQVATLSEIPHNIQAIMSVRYGKVQQIIFYE